MTVAAAPEKPKLKVADHISKMLFADNRGGDQKGVQWKEDPVTFTEFITSPNYLGQMPLSARQAQAMNSIVGLVPKETFTNLALPLESVLAYGKGSGKDLLASYLIAYLTYLVLCLVDPHMYFGLANDENIDIVNVASNARQAQDVFFAKLKARLSRPCFVRLNNGRAPRSTKQLVEFQGAALRLHSLHSANESWEGLNILAWIMDEASAFRTEGGKDNAESCYETLRSSADTRFMSFRWVGMVISFPRKQVGDFTLTKYKEAKDHPKMFADRAATWEVKPEWDPTHPMYREIPWVVLEELNLRVPEVYADQFRKNPTDCRTKYMAAPPPQEGGFFELPAKIYEAVDPELPHIMAEQVRSHREVLLPDGKVHKLPFIQLQLDALPPRHEGSTYFLHGDPGLTSDAFALCLVHTEGEPRLVFDDEGSSRELRMVVVDFIVAWEPKGDAPVDLLNVQDVILKICRFYGVKGVTFDRWNSATSIQWLLERGIAAADLSFSNELQFQMYRNLKLHFYSSLIAMPSDDEETQNELIFLKVNNTASNVRRIDHDVFGKDRADAVAAAVWSATGKKMSRVARLVAETLGDTAPAVPGDTSQSSFAILPRLGK